MALDGTTRSDPLGYVTDPEAFLDAAAAHGDLDADERATIDAHDTTVLTLRASKSTVGHARTDDPAVERERSIDGREVFTSVSAVDNDDVDWFVVSELPVGAAQTDLDSFRNILIVGAALFILILTFVAVAWASRLMAPIRAISERLGHTGDRVGTGDTIEIAEAADVLASSGNVRTPTEFEELAVSFESMTANLREQHALVATARADRLALLRNMLPASVAQRIMAGDLQALDEVEHASVAVIVVTGLGDLVRIGSAHSDRSLVDRLHTELDDLADSYGLDRVKVVGDAYFAACGHDRPYIDHAPRAVQFRERRSRRHPRTRIRALARLGRRGPHRTGHRRDDRRVRPHLRRVGPDREHGPSPGPPRPPRAGARVAGGARTAARHGARPGPGSAGRLVNSFGDTNVLWGVVVVIVVPLAVLAASEFDERLRQRESALRPAIDVLRVAVLPLVAVWALLVPVLALDRNTFAVRITETGIALSAAVVALRITGFVLDGIRDRRQASDRYVPQLLLLIPRIAILLVFGWFILAAVWDVNLSAALTALGVTSLVVSFALQDTLSGLASGFLLLSDHPFRPGDWITVGDIEGVVVDVNWRTTHIANRNGDTVIVPNSQLASTSITNRTSPDSVHRVVVSLSVAFSNPPTLAKEMLLDAARTTPGVLAEPPPGVRLTVIDDPLMGYDVDLWIADFAIEPRVRSDFGSLVWYQSHRHGVPLPSPAQDLYLHDAAATAAAKEPKFADVRRALQTSILLNALGDDALDRLARASHPARYARDELMIDSATTSRDVIIVVDGRADLVLLERAANTGTPANTETVIGSIGPGESVGYLESPRAEGWLLALRAATDCEVVVIGASAAAEAASRNADVAGALNRSAAMRRRRVERILDHRTAAP